MERKKYEVTNNTSRKLMLPGRDYQFVDPGKSGSAVLTKDQAVRLSGVQGIEVKGAAAETPFKGSTPQPQPAGGPPQAAKAPAGGPPSGGSAPAAPSSKDKG